MGEGFSHSSEVPTASEFIYLRDVDIPSQIIHINMITDRKETKDPKEDTVFHMVKASG
jgi:hypothetical protein